MHDNERSALRRLILNRRDGMDAALRAEKSRAACRLLLESRLLHGIRSALLYANFRGEVETDELFSGLRQQGITVCAPLTLVRQRRLLPFIVNDPANDLHPGYCGIPEPQKDLPPFDPLQLDLVVVPGSIFDRQGGRMGYGGGYYDRFLAADAPQALRVGIAFEEQVVEYLPLLPHDQQLHYLVTDQGIWPDPSKLSSTQQ